MNRMRLLAGLLAPGQDRVTFTLTLKHAAVSVKARPYHALINFSMIYE